MGTPSKRQRKVLTLADKVRVLEDVSQGMSNRAVAEKYKVGRTQINNIVLQKDKIQLEFNEGKSANSKYLVARHLQYPDIDKGVWNFFCEARGKNIPVNGRMLQDQADEIASNLGLTSFQASNGWLQKFTARHSIKMAVLHGESADVSQQTVDQWREKLPLICDGYADCDIYNMDETAIFYRLLPNKSYIKQGEERHGTKVIKDRYTVVCCANLAGEKEKLTIIGKSKRPHSFPKKKAVLANFNKFVTYRNNRKGWQTSQLFTEFLHTFNNKFKLQNRHVLLFLDNCPSHPDIQLSNVKLAFLPKNTTSKSQPLDQGIIKTLKTHYHKRVRNDARIAISDVSDINEFAKKINIFDAILNTKLAWDAVSPDTVTKCSEKCGITRNIGMGARPLDPICDNMNSAESENSDDDDPFMDVPLSQYIDMSNKMELEHPPQSSRCI